MIKRIMLLCAVCVILLAVPANARLSPAMDIIEKRLEMRKCMTSGTVMSFAQEDFERLFGTGVDSVTVIKLPPSDEGVLTVSDVAVREGQVIGHEQLERLNFSSSHGFSGVANIVFGLDDELSGTMCISVESQPNFAPHAGDMKIETQKNIAVFKNAFAADPEGDAMIFEVTKYPRHGSVEITSDGQIIYKPVFGFVGNDLFKYRVEDVHGNYSDEASVEIKVSRPAAAVYFDDMKNHWGHNSAIKMAATGLMKGEISDGKSVFNPEADMTRGDFLALSLIMSGHENEIPFVSETIFADDSMIPDNIKSYVQYAYDKGIISGYDNGDGSVNFESTGSISRAEAAVVTGKILDLPESNSELPTYKDLENIPAWASSAVCSLSATGIINGDANGEFMADKSLSRAEGAEIICNVAQYLEDKENKEKQQKKSIFNLFGLLG